MYLHPTMYLLILSNLQIGGRNLLTFTSHYVSINSRPPKIKVKAIIIFTSHYVSINSKITPIILFILSKFTSHYVSINSL